MKKLILILSSLVGMSFAALDIPEHMKAPLKQARKACMGETGVDLKYIEESKNGNLPDVPELRCYILCLMEHHGIIHDDGTVEFAKIYHLFTPSVKESFQQATNECATKHGETRCDTAYLTIKCFFELLPEGAELP
ncbi:general odorant-binding protein 69a-like [Contarinia nasturtii]|uniref:general odorant-binding protein 69a-like n=1 Tax=Contarinia nasturtii TaxID=265458 RepID=UPI0012D413A7|nr:general odorant-binding protein 69a-like [Contarinia nasturtii]